jgi:acetyltransferase-like isoleucine patch superfamily enzyme
MQPSSLRVEVGPDARIGWRAVLLPGARVTQGEVVPPGSVVRASRARNVEPVEVAPAATGRACPVRA